MGIADDDIELVLIDGPVTPVQQRNLERTWNTKVLDRTGLILEIFGHRARTREGRLQVELAQPGLGLPFGTQSRCELKNFLTMKRFLQI